MIDRNSLLGVLKINGINQTSSAAQVDSLLTALKYSDEDKKVALEFLRSQGWASDAIIEPAAPVMPPVPQTPTPVQPIPQPQPVIPPQPLTPPQPVQSYTQPHQPVVPPAPVIPDQPLQAFNPMPTIPPEFIPQPIAPGLKPKSNLWMVILGILILIGLVAGGIFGYSYFKHGGLVGVKSYTEDNFFSNLLIKSSQIDSSSYNASIAMDVGTRDADAVPFVVKVSNTAELRQQYQNDSRRAQDISAILSVLNYQQDYQNKTSVTYPVTLARFIDDYKRKYHYSPIVSLNDPVTHKPYEYKQTDGGKNFTLTATFEAEGSINTIKKASGNTATSTIVNGLTVTFTKDSSRYMYVASEPPQPLFVQVSELMRQMPADVSAKIGVSATSDWTQGAMADWMFNIDAEGSFGDLTYKINADALKKDSDYYFKINNFPSFFFGGFGMIKGKWVKVPATAATTSTGSDISYLTKDLPRYENSYKENREKLITLLKKASTIADDVKLVSFKNAPKTETVDGRSLTRYDVTIRKEAIVPFYKKLAEEVASDSSLSDYRTLIADQGLIEYLQSPEFDEVFDYYNKNTTFTFWTDSQGFPAIVQENIRIVPPDTATQLSGKQVNVVAKLVMSKINEKVNINAPKEAISIDDVNQQIMKNSPSSQKSVDAAMKGNLATLRSQAEIAYSTYKNSYGTKPFTLGACKQTAGTMFGDKDVFKLITDATNNNPSKASCVSKGKSGAVTSWAVSVPLNEDARYSYCVDSTGMAIQIQGALTSDKCQP